MHQVEYEKLNTTAFQYYNKKVFLTQSNKGDPPLTL